MLAAVLCVPVVVTGFASSVQGVHWPSDAIAGTATGVIAALAIDAVLRHAGGSRDPQSSMVGPQ